MTPDGEGALNARASAGYAPLSTTSRKYVAADARRFSDVAAAPSSLAVYEATVAFTVATTSSALPG